MARLRLMITKGENIRYISHLDYAKAIERGFRRSKLPVAYTEGFNPHSKISFGSALAVGVASSAEYIDVELTDVVELGKVAEQLAKSLGNGIKMLKAGYINKNSPALASIINLAVYEVSIDLPKNVSFEGTRSCIDEFNAAPNVLFVKESPKGRKQIDLKKFLSCHLTLLPQSCGRENRLILQMSVKITPQGSIKPANILSVLTDVYQLPIDKFSALITRTGLYIEKGDSKISPLVYK